VVRGCPPEWVAGIYSFGLAADLTFFSRRFEVSLTAFSKAGPKLNFSRAWTCLSSDPTKAPHFQVALEQYMAMSAEFNFVVTDANQNVETQQWPTQTGPRAD